MPARVGKDIFDFLKIKSKVDNRTGCWNWIGYVYRGYGAEPTSSWFKLYKVNRAHQLSYVAYKGEYRTDNPYEVVLSHLCHNKACINPDHLLACSVQENLDHDITNLRSPRYLSEDVNVILQDVGKLTNSQICNKYNISLKRFYKILGGETLSHLTNIKEPIKNSGTKISEEQVLKMFEMKSRGEKLIVIANEIGCSEAAVCRILKGNRRQEFVKRNKDKINKEVADKNL